MEGGERQAGGRALAASPEARPRHHRRSGPAAELRPWQPPARGQHEAPRRMQRKPQKRAYSTQAAYLARRRGAVSVGGLHARAHRIAARRRAAPQRPWESRGLGRRWRGGHGGELGDDGDDETWCVCVCVRPPSTLVVPSFFPLKLKGPQPQHTHSKLGAPASVSVSGVSAPKQRVSSQAARRRAAPASSHAGRPSRDCARASARAPTLVVDCAGWACAADAGSASSSGTTFTRRAQVCTTSSNFEGR